MQPHERREGEKKLWVSRAVSSSVNGNKYLKHHTLSDHLGEELVRQE